MIERRNYVGSSPWMAIQTTIYLMFWGSLNGWEEVGVLVCGFPY